MPFPALGDFEELPGLARTLMAQLRDARGLVECTLLSLEDALIVAVLADRLPPEGALAVVASFLAQQVERGDRRDQTVRKVAEIQSRFVAFQRARRPVDDVRDITRSDVLAFLGAPTLGDELRDPTDKTKDNRRWALALFFSTLRALGRYDGDPLLGVDPFPRSSVAYRPLTTAEVERCRVFARRSTRDTRGPAAWALAEATATTSEISAVTAADATAAPGRVWLTGGARNLARWGDLTGWGVEQIRRRLDEIDTTDPSTLLVYASNGSAQSRQASACDAVHETLKRAGFGGDRRIRPLSVPAWRGATIFADTGDIEAVRHALGVRSLDNARRIIGATAARCDLPPPHRGADR